MAKQLALSLRQPWAWLVVNGFKPIENRNRRTKVRGKILIHASSKVVQKEFDAAVEFARNIDPSIAIPPLEELPKGGVVGSAELVDCVAESKSPWFTGPYGYVLQEARTLKFHPCRGNAFFFKA